MRMQFSLSEGNALAAFLASMESEIELRIQLLPGASNVNESPRGSSRLFGTFATKVFTPKSGRLQRDKWVFDNAPTARESAAYVGVISNELCLFELSRWIGNKDEMRDESCE
ncbi:hypothetical protein K0M31_010714 [Melipona bicolor]|uniref:Uncharacterized protein n=1 Tax=Melipona bicolor TaxID=60889 RepID=A0AA40KHV9_9HYME|nr:hypothetical protein K0M31_010714 [Melipona bicolor]